jgi:hypothetical protein
MQGSSSHAGVPTAGPDAASGALVVTTGGDPRVASEPPSVVPPELLPELFPEPLPLPEPEPDSISGLASGPVTSASRDSVDAVRPPQATKTKTATKYTRMTSL